MERHEGYAPLASYSLLGDCRATALVAEDGAVDWFAAPSLATAPICAAVLDPRRGGALTLSPTVDHECTQRYLPDTMVLETSFRCPSGDLLGNLPQALSHLSVIQAATRLAAATDH